MLHLSNSEKPNDGLIVFCYLFHIIYGFLGGSDGKESACNVGDPGSTPGLGRSPGEGNGNPPSILPWRIPWIDQEIIKRSAQLSDSHCISLLYPNQ